MTTPDPFVLQHAGLVEVHGMLKTGLASLVAAPADLAAREALPLAGFLLAHHHVEETILFPGLRRLGRGRSADVAFLARCDREHAALHALCRRLAAVAEAPRPDVAELRIVARETLDAFTEHVAGEEVGLAPENLRAMIDEAGLLSIGRELEAFRAGR